MAFLLQLAREITARGAVLGFAVSEKEELHFVICYLLLVIREDSAWGNG
jgi:hypothetical protein